MRRLELAKFVPVPEFRLSVAEPPDVSQTTDMAGSVADAVRKQIRRYWLVSEHRSAFADTARHTQGDSDQATTQGLTTTTTLGRGGRMQLTGTDLGPFERHPRARYRPLLVKTR